MRELSYVKGAVEGRSTGQPDRQKQLIRVGYQMLPSARRVSRLLGWPHECQSNLQTVQRSRGGRVCVAFESVVGARLVRCLAGDWCFEVSVAQSYQNSIFSSTSKHGKKTKTLELALAINICSFCK